MNLNKYINSANIIPFNYNNSLLVNYFIDDNFSSDPNRGKMLLIRLLVPAFPENIALFNNELGDNIDIKDEFLIVDIISKEYKDLIVEYETRKEYIYSNVIDITYDLKTYGFKIDFKTKDKELFNLCFVCKDINYILIGSVNKKDINDTKTKSGLIYCSK